MPAGVVLYQRYLSMLVSIPFCMLIYIMYDTAALSSSARLDPARKSISSAKSRLLMILPLIDTVPWRPFKAYDNISSRKTLNRQGGQSCHTPTCGWNFSLSRFPHITIHSEFLFGPYTIRNTFTNSVPPHYCPQPFVPDPVKMLL